MNRILGDWTYRDLRRLDVAILDVELADKWDGIELGVG